MNNWGILVYVETQGTEHLEIGLTEQQAKEWFKQNWREDYLLKWADGHEVTVSAFEMKSIRKVNYE